MKPKDQVTIALITAFAGVAGVLFYFFKYCLGRNDNMIYTIFPLGLAAPIVYAVFLIRGKASPAKVTFWLWFAGWIIYLCLTSLNLAYQHHWIAGTMSPMADTIYKYFAAVTAFPLFAFMFSTWQIEPFIRHLIVGVILMGLLWTGTRGAGKS